MRLEIYKGSTPGPSCLWTPDGHAIPVRSQEPPMPPPQPRPRPRIAMIPHLVDLLRESPQFPRATLTPAPRRMIAYCSTCRRTVYEADYEHCRRDEHDLRYMLVPDLRKEKPEAAA